MDLHADLCVVAGLDTSSEIVIPAAELTERFTRSPGPGGQSVNTTDSRVELIWDPTTATGLSATQRMLLLSRTAGRPLRVVAHRQRSQYRNRIGASALLAARLEDLLAPVTPRRRPTAPSRRGREQRLEAKRLRGQTKALHGRLRSDPDA
jgi:ribosome-associated protein